MKVCLIIPSFYPAVIYGGPIFSTLYVSQELAMMPDVEVNVSTSNANMTTRLNVETSKWIQLKENLNVKYYNDSIIGKISFPLLFGVWRDIRGSDVVHIEGVFSTPTPISILFSKFFGKPVMLSPRGQLGEWCLKNGSKFKSLWLRIFIKPFVKIIIWHATSEQEKDEILALFQSARVEVIPNGIHYDEYRNVEALTRYEAYKHVVPNDKECDQVIVSMGRIQKVKGFDILIEAFVDVLSKYPNAILLVAGQDEGEKDFLEKMIIELGLVERVIFVGHVAGEEKIRFLMNADIFVLPSHHENFGNVYLESLAAGTPIVASKNTPWKIVEDRGCGRWVENSIAETSAAILDLLERDRDEMRYKSRLLAQEFAWSIIARKFRDIFSLMEIR